MMTFTEEAVLLLVGAAIGLISATIGAVVQHYFTSIQAEKQRAHEVALLEKQLEEKRQLTKEEWIGRSQLRREELERRKRAEIRNMITADLHTPGTRPFRRDPISGDKVQVGRINSEREVDIRSTEVKEIKEEADE